MARYQNICKIPPPIKWQIQQLHGSESLIDEDGNYPVAAASFWRHHLHRLRSGNEGICIVTFGGRKSSMHRRQRQQPSCQFYSDDPQANGALLTTYHTDVDVQAGERIERTITIPETAMTSIWMIVNTDKYPIIVPTIVHTTSTSDSHRQCPDLDAPSNSGRRKKSVRATPMTLW